MTTRTVVSVVSAALLTALGTVAPARHAFAPQERVKVPVLFDTDVGGDIDDALALALVLSSPELDLRGVTTVDGDAHTRALIVCRLLHAVGRGDVPVASGKPPQEPPDYRGQLQYGLRPCFRKRPVKESAVEFLYNQLKANKGELTLLAVGPLTNVAELFTKHPDCKPWVKRVVVMGGALRVGYEGKPPAVPEWNIKSDVEAAKKVFAAGVPLVVAPLDATVQLKLDEPRRVIHQNEGLNRQLKALYQLGDNPNPVLFDPLAAALCFEERFCTFRERRLEVDDKGVTQVVEGKPNCRVAETTDRDSFVEWYCDRVAPKGFGRVSPTRKPANVSAPVPRGNFPDRIHVIEDYETDIERRWWLCGKLETKNVPPGSTRACRGVHTNDFDDRMGDPEAAYTAVIFNPVPGPPMGKHTRLGFRYWLKGTSTLRVQLYSLTNGYHRHLTLTDLPEGKWESAVVDMTRARRPDGSGGPLAEDERIDDLQFYTAPDAELILDDVVLYDAAPADEKRPFPRPLFTGWFDTGKQGKEWPGSFDIVSKEKPLTWKAARSVPGPDTGAPWVRLHLRGERPLGESTHLRFRYRLGGADSMRVRLVGRGADVVPAAELKGLKQGEWAEAVVDFGKTKTGDRADEVHFALPKGAELFLDDVLLYEPGKPEGR